ncbi:hypothetical protein FRC06_008963, partial [Ceratobasidium sp. 370]
MEEEPTIVVGEIPQPEPEEEEPPMVRVLPRPRVGPEQESAVGAGSVLIEPEPSEEEIEYRHHPLAGRYPVTVSRRGTRRATPRRASQPLPRQDPATPEPEPIPAQSQPAPHIPADPEPNLPEPPIVAPPQYQPTEQPVGHPQAEEPFNPQDDPAQRIEEEVDLQEVEDGIQRLQGRLEDFAQGAVNLNNRLTAIEGNLVWAVNNSYEAHQEAQRAHTAANQTPTWVEDLLRGNNEVLKEVKELRDRNETTSEIIQAMDGRIDALTEKVDQIITNTTLSKAPQSTRRRIVPPVATLKTNPMDRFPEWEASVDGFLGERKSDDVEFVRVDDEGSDDAKVVGLE